MPDRFVGLALAAARRILTILALTGLGSAHAGERPERVRLCPEDAPDGVRLPSRPGCGRTEDRAGTTRDDFRDLGNGVRLKIGGRAGSDYDVRR